MTTRGNEGARGAARPAPTAAHFAIAMDSAATPHPRAAVPSAQAAVTASAAPPARDRAHCRARRLVWTPPWLLLLAALIGVGVVSLAPRTAQACQACACGDATFVSVDVQQPWVLHVGWYTALRRERYGANGLPFAFREWRSDVTLGLTASRVSVAMRLPYVQRSLEVDGLRIARGTNLSDIETVFMWHVLPQERAAELRRQFTLHAGMVWPSGPQVTGDSFEVLPPDVQPGTGAFTPFLGWGFVANQGIVRWDGRQSVYLPLPSRFDFQVGNALQTRVRAMFAVIPELRLGGGLYAQWMGQVIENGHPEEDTGGFLLSVDLEAEGRIADAVTVFAGARLPVVQGLLGNHEARPGFYAGVRWDHALRRERAPSGDESTWIVSAPGARGGAMGRAR